MTTAKRPTSHRLGPVPGCPKIHSWTERLDARRELLRQWKIGNFICNGTHWCNQHDAYHLTSHAKTTGRNYAYRD